jgi:hypothetical protein
MNFICVVCKKEDRGDGIWSYPDGTSPWLSEDSLCPECCRQICPQFRSRDKRRGKPMLFGLFGFSKA